MPKCLKFYKDPNGEKARAYRKRMRERYYGKNNFSLLKRKGNNTKYTKEEIKMILAHTISDRELAKKLGRSCKAIGLKRTFWNKKKRERKEKRIRAKIKLQEKNEIKIM